MAQILVKVYMYRQSQCVKMLCNVLSGVLLQGSVHWSPFLSVIFQRVFTLHAIPFLFADAYDTK